MGRRSNEDIGNDILYYEDISLEKLEYARGRSRQDLHRSKACCAETLRSEHQASHGESRQQTQPSSISSIHLPTTYPLPTSTTTEDYVHRGQSPSFLMINERVLHILRIYYASLSHQAIQRSR